VPRRGTPTRSRFDELFDQGSGTHPTSAAESSSLALIRGIVLHSDRLTIISARQVQYEVELGLLRTLAFDMSHTMRTMGLTLREGWQPTAAQSRFLDLPRTGGRELAG
jgi:DNA-binding transcriptional LysR family regulator